MENTKKATLLELIWTFFKIGLFSFGGGYSTIALIQSICVEKNHWATSDELLDIMAIAESTPGPIAINVATFMGNKYKGVIGGILSTLSVVLPSLIILSIISLFYDQFISNIYVAKAFKGIIAAVIVILFFACLNMYKNVRKHGNKIANGIFLLLGALLHVFFPSVPTVILILGSAAIGIIIYKTFLKEDAK